MDVATLKELAGHQAWADAEHWKTLNANPALLEDAEILERLSHIVQACRLLTALATEAAVDFAALRSQKIAAFELEAAMRDANRHLAAALETTDLAKSISLPRGPKGPFQAPAGSVFLQALTHGQHHRGQNAARMRALGVTPPMTDFIIWYAQGRP